MNNNYQQMIERNIGLLSIEEQETLRNLCVAVFGLGGLGGVIIEILVRAGIISFKIVDDDKFEVSNLNRQIYAFLNTINKNKIDVTEEFSKNINPEVKIEKYQSVSEKNIKDILNKVNIAVLALDSIKPIIIISRTCAKLNIPLIEGWALPFGNVRVFTNQTPSLEEVYNLPTKGREISSITEEEFKQLKNYMLSTLKEIKGIEEFYGPLAIQKIMEGRIPSFAPMVWLNAVIMSIEVIKIALGWGKISFAPNFSLYDPFNHKIPNKEV